MLPSISFDQARKVISNNTSATGAEIVELTHALGRIPIDTLFALQPQPGYDQSSYDGYVIPRKLPREQNGFLQYQLAGEIAAGNTEDKSVIPGQAYRIMTGGAIPKGGWKVIPQEVCVVDGDVVQITSDNAMTGAAHIRKKGCEQRPGSPVVPAGKMLVPQQLGRLADGGYQRITVHRRPRVSFFCTGSELVDDPGRQEKGMKMSSNRYLLSGLIEGCGGEPQDCGTVDDTITKMSDRILDISNTSMSDIIISTGGMGPGKYDILEETFTGVGGEVIFSSLQLRPGKSVLFGILGKSLYFGLPGPPPAVRGALSYAGASCIIESHGFEKVSQKQHQSTSWG